MDQAVLVLLAVLAALLALCALAGLAGQVAIRRWKQQFRTGAGPARTLFDTGRTGLAQAQQEATAYDPADGEPYGPLAGELCASLARAAHSAQDVTHLRADIRRRVSFRPGDRLGRLWFLFVVEPWTWWQIERRALAVTAAYQDRVRQVNSILEQLRALLPATAKRCLAAQNASRHADNLVSLLRAAGAHGRSLDAVERECGRLAAEVRSLPNLGPDPGVTGPSPAAKAGVIAACQVLSRLEASLTAQVARLEEWQAELETIRAALAALHARLALARDSIDRLPASIDGSELETDLQALEAAARRLALHCAAPDVDHLAQLDSQAADLSERAAGLAALVARVLERHDYLLEVLRASSVLLAEIETRMSRLARQGTWPIAWGTLEQELDRLKRIQSRIERDPGRHTPTELEADCGLAARLLADGQALGRKVTAAETHREALIGLLQDPDVRDSTWLAAATALGHEIGPYAPENWPAHLAPRRLVSDANRLSTRLSEATVQSDTWLPAAGLEQRVDALRRAVDAIGPLKQRTREIEIRLEALRSAERQARGEIEPAHRALALLCDGLRDSPVRLTGVLSRQRRALDRQRRRGRGILDSLEQRGTGLVEHKLRQTVDWRKSAQRDLQAALPLLAGEAEHARAALAGRLEAVRQIAPLDEEQSVRAAHRLLAAQTAGPDHGPWAGGRWSRRAVPAAREIEPLLHDWQQGAGLLAALREKVEQPLKGPLAALHKARGQAENAVAAAAALKQEVERGWPPFRCDTEPASRRLQSARDQEEQLRASCQTVAEVRLKAEQIADQYARAQAEAGRFREEVTRQQQDLRALATQLTEWQDRLSRYRSSHTADAPAAAAIDKRVAHIQAETNNLRQRWQGRPPYPEDARDALRQAWQAAREDIWPEGSGRLRTRDIESATR